MQTPTQDKIGRLWRSTCHQKCVSFQWDKKGKEYIEHMTTFNGGSLGSCIDEERSELRYVM